VAPPKEDRALVVPVRVDVAVVEGPVLPAAAEGAARRPVAPGKAEEVERAGPVAVQAMGEREATEEREAVQARVALEARSDPAAVLVRLAQAVPRARVALPAQRDRSTPAVEEAVCPTLQSTYEPTPVQRTDLLAWTRLKELAAATPISLQRATPR
jgi:hypothetical protein